MAKTLVEGGSPFIGLVADSIASTSGLFLGPVPDLAQHVRRDARELARLEQDPIDVPPVEETLDVLRQVTELGLLQAALVLEELPSSETMMPLKLRMMARTLKTSVPAAVT